MSTKHVFWVHVRQNARNSVAKDITESPFLIYPAMPLNARALARLRSPAVALHIRVCHPAVARVGEFEASRVTALRAIRTGRSQDHSRAAHRTGGRADGPERFGRHTVISTCWARGRASKARLERRDRQREAGRTSGNDGAHTGRSLDTARRMSPTRVFRSTVACTTLRTARRSRRGIRRRLSP